MGAAITARIEKRPMWFVCHTAVNEPSAATVACTVGAHSQLVSDRAVRSRPSGRAALRDTVPVTRSCLLSSADALLATVIPSAVAVTATFPECTMAVGSWCGGPQRRASLNLPSR